MLNKKIKNFWIEKINELKQRKGVASNLLTVNEGNSDDTVWQKKIDDLEHWDEIEDFALNICRDIYDKATVTNAGDTWPNNWGDKLDKLAANSNGESARDEYWAHLWKTLAGFERFILKDYKATATNLANREAQIKTSLNRASTDAIPNNWHNDIKTLLTFLVNTLNVDPANLPAIPVGEDLATLLARPSQTELDNANDWIDDLERIFKDILEIDQADALPNNFVDLANLYINTSGNKTVIELKDEADKYQAIQTKLNGEDLDTLINHTCSTFSHTDYDTIKQERDQLKTQADNFDRIHTKLNGKVSDDELDAFNNAINHTCSDCHLTKHNDYETIKQERDQLKTKQNNYQCDCDDQVAQKETEIINKIITDLQLSTERERERENVLEAVIAEIKSRITPPDDNSANKQKISELETKLTNLQTSQSLNNLPISEEVKNEAIKVSQELGLTAQSCAKLESASSYQELSSLQKAAFQEKLNSEVSSKKTALTLNYVLGALTIGSLLALIYLLVKKTKNKLPGIEPKK